MGGLIPIDNTSLSLPIVGADLSDSGTENRGHLIAVPCTAVIERLQLTANHSWYGDRVRSYLSASLSEATKRAYAGDLEHYLGWGGEIPATPEQVAEYLAHHAELLSPFTLNRRLAALSTVHGHLGHPNPTTSPLVKMTLRGVKRRHGAPQRQVEPILREDIFDLIRVLPETTKGVRDRALLLIGFAGAFRRSELVSLTVEDARFVPEGMVLRLRRSKTDQEGVGRDIGVPYGRSRACPVKALRAWLDLSGITSGPIFRGVGKGGRLQAQAVTGQSVALIIKEYAELAGLNPERLSGHSLRAGLITSAAKMGVSSWKIRQQSGHKSEAMLARYVRDGELFVNNAAGAVL